ncbi:MAG: bi-domain-containing oxidoreductase [Acidobacteriaceae bacterium]|nr:bi-domain-containing oxidoreductase [Acidobacteriaceae bacterium]MBV9779057.1 bi-domain-containing oxidoreductase [Acidobacteriaceae bacterium]
MQQVLQNLGNGTVQLASVPCPRTSAGQLLIRTSTTLISSGTERMLLDFGKANWIEKARQQPDKVCMIFDKVKTDGLLPTIESVRSKLDQPVPLGYSNAGVVIEAGESVTEFQPGHRVISNGPHAEVVSVPKNLCARIPDSVSDEAACFTVVSAVALEGLRLVAPTLGECIVVTGLGLIGLLTVQLLKANGCRVLGLDFDSHKLALAEQFGATTVNLSAGQDPVSAAEHFSHGHGVDAVLITAATKSNEPVHQAALMCRKRGRIVLVGVAGLELSRDDFYKKELSFQVSCSYGPGRYDPSYEQAGQDYPYPYVRWTAQRNFEAVLEMLAEGRLNVEPLITHRFPFDDANDAYGLIQSNEPQLGVLLKYPAEPHRPVPTLIRRTIALSGNSTPFSSGPKIAFVGAGAYATKVLMPAFQATGAQLETAVSNTGLSAAHVGRKYRFNQASTEPESAFSNPNVDTIVIATRHDSHARYVRQAIRADKNVFVEKPLAISTEEVDQIEQDYISAIRNGSAGRVMVGFNRRFAPQVVKMKSLLEGLTEPKAIILTVNAGAIPPDHWTQDAQIGGGRVIGEACHFIDLARFLAGAPAISVQAMHAQGINGSAPDTLSFSIAFAGGSIATIHYFACGNRAFPKERVEVFCGGRILQLDNFHTLRGWGWKNFRRRKLWRQDKGANNMAKAFVTSIRDGKPAPIPFEEILEVSRTTLQVANL